MVIYFAAWMTGIVSSVTSNDSQIISPTIIVFSPISAYDGNAGVMAVCVFVRNAGQRDLSLNGTTAYLKDSSKTISSSTYEGNAVLFPSSAEQICFSFDPPVPGYYDVVIHVPSGSIASASLRILPYCNSDADCPDTVNIKGPLLNFDDMYCHDGYCDVHTSESYFCSDINAQNCDTASVGGITYYCEVHGSDNVWLSAPTEFRDDLKDNDCDGTVERECDSCASCTHELNVVGPSVISSGHSFIVHISQNILPTDSTLVDGGAAKYWDSNPYVCVLVDSGESYAEGTFVFDGDGHTIDLSLATVSATAIRIYGTDGVTIRNIYFTGGGMRAISMDGSDGCILSDVAISGASMGVLIGGSGSTLRRIQISCGYPDSIAIEAMGVNDYLTFQDVNIAPDCNYGLYLHSINDSLFRDLNVLAPKSYFFSPKYNTYDGAISANGKPICEYRFSPSEENVSVYADGSCSGYIMNTGANVMNFFLNGQTITGYGVGADSGTLVIHGPGGIVGNVSGIYYDHYAKAIVVDLSGGDVNLCDNDYSVYSSSLASVTCTGCGNGYHLYVVSTDYVGCDSNCVQFC